MNKIAIVLGVSLASTAWGQVCSADYENLANPLTPGVEQTMADIVLRCFGPQLENVAVLVTVSAPVAGTATLTSSADSSPLVLTRENQLPNSLSGRGFRLGLGSTVRISGIRATAPVGTSIVSALVILTAGPTVIPVSTNPVQIGGPPPPPPPRFNYSTWSLTTALRRGGLTEPVGSIVLTPGQFPIGSPVFLNDPSLQVTLNAPVTRAGQALSDGRAVAGSIDSADSQVVRYAVRPGMQFEVNQLRVRTGAANNTVTAQLLLQTGSELVGTNPNPVPIGFNLPSSLQAKIVSPGGVDLTTPIRLNGCLAQNGDLALNPAAGSAPESFGSQINLAETFSFSFRSLMGEGSDATTGTRVRYLFRNVPKALEIYLPMTIRSGQLELRRVATDSTLSGVQPGTTRVDLAPTSAALGGIRRMDRRGTDQRFAVYEVVSSDQASVESANIPLIFAYAPNTLRGQLPAEPTLSIALAPNFDEPFPNPLPIPSFTGNEVEGLKPVRIEDCACPVNTFSRLTAKSGLLNNRTWTVAMTNTGTQAFDPATRVAFAISKLSGPGTATLLSPATVNNVTLAPATTRTFGVNLAFTGTDSTSRFALTVAAQGGCLNSTATITNQAP